MLDSNTMLREARARAGSSSFGSEDFIVDLQRLVDALNTQAKLTAQGEQRFHTAGVYLLNNRLLLQKFLAEHPEAADADIGEAVMIVGMPRTGSTKLQRLIAQDRRLDHLTLMDVALPLKFPGETGSEIRAPLIRAMESALGQPELMAGHNLSSAEPEEEVELQKNHFTARLMHDHAAIPDWIRTVGKLNRRPKYELMRQFIVANKIQNNRQGIAWIFKNAYAGEDLDIIAEVFPNAKFVFTHRDPVEQVGSITALGYKWRCFHSDRVDKLSTGADYLKFWSEFTDQTLAAFKKIPSDRLMHVRYRDVVANSESLVKDIYAFAGYPLTVAAETAMQDYDRNNFQHRHGKHDYSLAEFGLSAEKVRDSFGTYYEAFGSYV